MILEPLPVDSVLAELLHQLSLSPIVLLNAPPGSGKSTRVAPYLSQLQTKQKTYLLQPRRIAARSVAQRIAEENGWQVGDQVGYQVRFENRLRSTTPLVVATEGILLRKMTKDPFLEDTATVILDEFHERSIHSDLLLGMLRRVQSEFRPDLKTVIMSATLDAESLSSNLGEAPIVRASGLEFPVEYHYFPERPNERLRDHVVRAIQHYASKDHADLLVFLPGIGEIRSIRETLQRIHSLCDWWIAELHGSLPLEEQNRILVPSKQPRIILATNVAETSLTIAGIRTVIDSGLARVLRFDPQSGLDRLQLEPISRASATQRAGRAGRLGPGKAIRLWHSIADRGRSDHLEPEIQRIDLSSAILQLSVWGENDPLNFPWIDAPREDAIESARRLLHLLGALRNDRVTEIGRQMAQLPLSPRLARLVLEGHRLGQLDWICRTAALLSERSPFVDREITRQTRRWDSDVAEQTLALHRFQTQGIEESAFGEVHRSTARSIEEVAQRIESDILREWTPAPSSIESDPTIAIQRALLAAFPDRLVKRRQPQSPRGIMVGGRGVSLSKSSGVTDAEYFLAIDLEGSGAEAQVRLASTVKLEWLDSDFFREREELYFHPSQKQVVARLRRYWGDLLLQETPITISDEEQCTEVLFEAAKQHWDQCNPLKMDSVRNLVGRIEFLRKWAPELGLPEMNLERIQIVLRKACKGSRGLDDLRQIAWTDWLQGELTTEQSRALEREAPERFRVPSGNQIRLQYDGQSPPILAARIQELFSLLETPRIACGRVALCVHLLAPNMRPQQITEDLASFWKNTYQVVRKELRRRYPKHAWPEDPLTAQPIRKP